MSKEERRSIINPLNEFIPSIVERGLIICGTLGSYKTSLIKALASELIDNSENLKLRIFDAIDNWRYNFRQDISNQTIKSINQYVDWEPDTTLFTLSPLGEDARLMFITRIISQDFKRQQREYKTFKGHLEQMKQYVYIVEEANTILSSYSIKKGFWRDFVAFARNYKMSGIYVMQRLADSSPKIIERIPNMAICQTIGINEKRRIKAILPEGTFKKHQIDTPREVLFYINGTVKKITHLTHFNGEPTYETVIKRTESRFLFSEKVEYMLRHE